MTVRRSIGLLLLLSLVSLGSGRPKLTVYYPIWCQRPLDLDGYGLPPKDIQYSGIDYIVHFPSGIMTTFPPYFNLLSGMDSINLFYRGDGSGNTSVHYQSQLIDSAHAHGTKVLLSIEAVNPGEGWNYVCQDSSRTEVFATAFTLFARRHGYDGWELNVEQWQTPIQSIPNHNRAIRILRRRGNDAWYPGRPIFFTSANRDDFDLYYASQDSAIDMHNLQCYNYASIWNANQGTNNTWFQTPLRVPSGYPAGLEIQALAYNFLAPHRTVPQEWVHAGHPLSKIGIGMGVYGQIFVGTNTWGGLYYDYTNDLQIQEVRDMLNHGGTYTFNASAASPYISGTATGNPRSKYSWAPANGQFFYCVFDDTAGIAKKILWSDSQGVAGIMLYDFKGDMHTGRTMNNRLPTIYRAVSVLQSLAPSAPMVTTGSATSISQTTATLNGVVNANGASTSAWFAYGTLSGVYTDSAFAVESPIPGGVSTTSTNLTGLNAGTTYYYRARAFNSYGNAQGNEASFTTNVPTPPTMTTTTATSITQVTAIANGTVNPHGASTVVRFVYGRTSNSYTDSVLAVQSPVGGGTTVSVFQTLSSLLPNTTYYVRVRGYNVAGGSQGNQISFTTSPAPPTGTTTSATAITQTTATLNGVVNANGVSTTVRFVYGRTSDTYTDSVTATQSPVIGTTPTAVSRGITNLLAGTTYYVRVRAYSSGGGTQGDEVTFVTDAGLPTATTRSASSITLSSAVLNGYVTANGMVTTVWFVYGFSPGVYTDSVAAAQGPILGDSAVSAMIGVVSNSVCYYRVRASNALGSAQGEEVSFWTPMTVQYYQVPAGWTIVSVPLTVPDLRTSQVFPSATSRAYVYIDPIGYAARDTLENAVGYWMKFQTTQTVPIFGNSRTQDTLEVRPGWNLIGSVTDSVPVDNIIQIPPGLVISPFYRFDSTGYSAVTSIGPMRGYCFKASGNGTLILSSPASRPSEFRLKPLR